MEKVWWREHCHREQQGKQDSLQFTPAKLQPAQANDDQGKREVLGKKFPGQLPQPIEK